MDKYEETFATWNNVASIYQDKFMGLDLYNETYDYICNSIDKPKPKLLEVGCGPGNITKYLLSQRPDFEVFGIDIAPNMIELARLNNPSAQFAVMDIRQINSLDIKYDGVICGFGLPYLSPTESEELISNSYDLLNDNGLIYLSFVEGDPQKSDFKVGIGGRVYFYFHNLENLKSQLSRTNFDKIETFKLNYKISETEFDIHTILIAKKKNAL
jgi:2-polyprenyl-3-methyl-5-hydroxy-6-metoxy-1,4-benzoquinol methylase